METMRGFRTTRVVVAVIAAICCLGGNADGQRRHSRRCPHRQQTLPRYPRGAEFPKEWQGDLRAVAKEESFSSTRGAAFPREWHGEEAQEPAEPANQERVYLARGATRNRAVPAPPPKHGRIDPSRQQLRHDDVYPRHWGIGTFASKDGSMKSQPLAGGDAGDYGAGQDGAVDARLTAQLGAGQAAQDGVRRNFR